jgi:hypothetical protein
MSMTKEVQVSPELNDFLLVRVTQTEIWKLTNPFDVKN